MKKSVILVAFAGMLLFSTPVQAAWNPAGNYFDADGCIHVVERYRLFGINWGTRETVFCPDGTVTNPDGSVELW